MQKPEIWKLVLSQFASSNKAEPSANDWRTFITRCLGPEVKNEIARFYGLSDDDESQYPGLDYADANHRLRLSSFPYHHQLFKAFDNLRLTDIEIYTLCKWHGTKRSKDEFERKHNVKIEDTTWDDVQPYTPREPTITICKSSSTTPWRTGVAVSHLMHEEEEAIEEFESGTENEMADNSDASAEDSEDEVQQSVGLELNQRLLANAEANAQARARGELVSMDADWEQWLKEAAEREAAQDNTEPNAATSFPDLPRIRQQYAYVSARMLARARGSVPQSTGVSQGSQTASADLRALLNAENVEASETTLPPTVEGH